MSREDLLLTETELLELHKKYGFGDLMICQAQLDKVLKGNWVDKPDSEGWWWFEGCYEAPDWGEGGIRSFIYIIRDMNDDLEADNEISDLDFYKGKFTKAIVPEKE